MTNVIPSFSTYRYTWSLRNSAFDENSEEHTFDQIFLNRISTLYPSRSSGTGSLPSLVDLPQPSLMKDMHKATQRVLTALANQEKIVVFGDYDVDGTTACALLSRFFKSLTYAVDVYIPDRIQEGYGLNPIGVSKVFASKNSPRDISSPIKNPGLIITVDNGISAHAGVAAANDMGIDVIITDHHEPPQELPEAYAILNPKQSDCGFPEKHISGVGVAFFFMISIRSALRTSGLWCKSQAHSLNLSQYLDLVAIGTIADMVPLTGINHIVSRVGLQVLAHHITRGARPGVAALLNLAGVPIDSSVWKPSGSDISFKLAPRLNAAGRLGSAMAAYKVLETDDISIAKDLAQKLHEENALRQKMQEMAVEEALEKVSRLDVLPPVLMVYNPNWHPGIVGLVASRLVEKYNRPAVVLGAVGGKWKGSGRSTPNFDLFNAIEPLRNKLLGFGGHFHAIGLSIEESAIPVLESYLQDKALMKGFPSGERPCLWIDGIALLSQLNDFNLSRFFSLEPFGQGNQKIRLLVKNLILKKLIPVGKVKEKGHARVLLCDGFHELWAIGFQMASELESLQNLKPTIDVVLEFKQGVWQGKRRIECQIIDFSQ